jgi:rfaE bifunctional protein kinase chain/domain
LVKFSPNRLNDIFSAINGKKILVLGDIMIDEYLWGKVNRLSPEAPVPIIEIEDESLRFGGGANVALNLKTLGCEPIIIGVTGNDRMGEIFLNMLSDSQMRVDGIVQTKERPTTVKTRIIGENQHIARVDREKTDSISESVFSNIKSKLDDILPETEAVILQDYNKGLLTKELIEYCITKANEKNKIITVDPKFINFMEYKNVTVFKPNVKETAQALACILDTEEDIQNAGKELKQRLQAKNILLTLGARGMALITESDEYAHVNAKTRKVADVSGAGDTVISTLTAALAAGANIKEAASMANYAAGIVCEEVGIVPIYPDRLKKEILN